MAKTIANVLVGVAGLFIRQPNDAIAEWSEPGYLASPQSAKLLKTGLGAAGSTHVQFIPPTGITFLTAMGDATIYGFYDKRQVLAGANWCQMELRFEDPNSVGWVEVTSMPFQGEAGDGIWTTRDMVDAGADTMYGGHDEMGNSIWHPALENWSAIRGLVNADVDNADDWILTRVRVELWEPGPARYCYIGQVTINGIDYAVTPGGDAPGMSLGSPFAEVGYTEDGVTIEYTADETDIEVEEETFPIKRVITKETLAVTCNMAESSLFNIDKAMAGAVLSGSIITLGDGVNKEMNIKITGINPDGFITEILLPRVTATGAVGMSYRKGEKTIVPITFQALKPATGKVCTIVYNAA